MYSAKAQVAAPILFPFPDENISLSHKAVYALAGDETKNHQAIAALSFKKLPAFESAAPIFLPDSVESGWIYFAIKNTLAVDTAVIIKTHPQARRNFLYEQHGKQLIEIGRSGSRMPYSQLSDKDPARIKIILKANATRLFYFRQQRHGLASRLDVPDLQTERQAMVEKYQSHLYILPVRDFTLLILGFHFAFFIFGAVKYNNSPNSKSYLWFALSNLFSFIFISAEGSMLILDFPIWNNLNQGDYFLFFNIAAVLSYLKFQIEFLQLKLSWPKLVKAIRIYGTVVAAAAIITMVVNQLKVFPYAFDFTRALSHGLLVFFIIILFHLRKNKTGINKFIYHGMLCWLIGIGFYIPYIWLDLKRFLPPLIRGNFIMGVPAAIEVFFFMKALVYRDQETERQKIKFQQELIEQLKQNEVLQQSFTRDLENQVEERTTELLEQRQSLELQREEKLRMEFDRKFSESELKALRSQINPHFIFNVLNTIESFALENNSDAASDMIQKFSRLTRLVLENSQHQIVPLESDLQALSLYIELEQIRYSGKFISDVCISQDVLEGHYFIPPMIIQPYVENAILHGLRNLPDNGVLKIRVSRQASYLAITIEDNGIGRIKSAALKQDDVINRTSMGMSVTQDRISIFNNLTHHNKATVAIYDLDRGTRVELLFPAELFNLYN